MKSVGEITQAAIKSIVIVSCTSGHGHKYVQPIGGALVEVKKEDVDLWSEIMKRANAYGRLVDLVKPMAARYDQLDTHMQNAEQAGASIDVPVLRAASLLLKELES